MRAALENWKGALKTEDLSLLRSALSEDAVLVSPLTNQFTFDGRDTIVELMADVFQVLKRIEVLEEVNGEGHTALFLRAHVGDTPLEEAQHIRFNSDGLIHHITLYMRTIPAMTKLLRGLGPLVARRQHHPATARLLVVTGALLDNVAQTGDRRFVPLAAPHGGH